MSHMAFVTKQKCGEDPFHSSSFMTKVESLMWWGSFPQFILYEVKSFLNPICICFVSLNNNCKDMLLICWHKFHIKKEITWRVAIW
jgi:hypothetical protein